MTQPAVLFRDIHYLHLKVRDLRQETEAGPGRLRKFRLKIEEQEKQLHAWQEKLKRVKVDIHAKETSIKDNNLKIEKFQGQMAAITNKKEYDALRHEIDNHRHINRVIEDGILELMIELDELAKKTPELEQAVKAAKDEYAKAEVDLGGRVKELTSRLSEAEASLKTAQENLPPDIKAIYDRLAKAYGEAALCPLAGQSCAGCYTDLTPQGYNDLKAGRMVLCKNCGKLLYLPE